MRSRSFPFLILVPIACWYVVFLVWPVINSFRTSFYEWNVIDPSFSPFIGLRNYIKLLNDYVFIKSFWNTIIYVFFKTAIGVPLSLAVAVLLMRLKRGRDLHLFFIFLPAVCAVAAMSVLFRWLYQPTFGLFNTILKMLGLPPQGFLSDPAQAIYAIVATDIWQGLGYGTVIFLAGLMDIPVDFEEAAKIDGATGWQSFFKVTLPLLGNVTLFVVVTTLIGAFQVFDRIAVMTNQGGPGTSSYVIAYFIYRYGIFHMRVGYATAAAVIMFFMIIGLTLLQMRALKPQWRY
ncbi:MAG: sugar ABC transporter permease [Firmicutes bacterium]|nr:sugar ABC transporter permease [Bacillota bacterium]